MTRIGTQLIKLNNEEYLNDKKCREERRMRDNGEIIQNNDR